MKVQRRYAPISGRFEPERVAGFAGISTHRGADRRVVQETEAVIKKDGKKRNVSEDLRFAIIEGVELSVTEFNKKDF